MKSSLPHSRCWDAYGVALGGLQQGPIFGPGPHRRTQRQTKLKRHAPYAALWGFSVPSRFSRPISRRRSGTFFSPRRKATDEIERTDLPCKACVKRGVEIFE